MIRIAICGALAAVGAAATAAAHDLSAAIERVRPGVVSVLPVWPGRPPDAEEPEGSGVVLGDGRHVLTAAHVLGNAETIRVRSADGTIWDAAFVAADAFTDLAVLNLPAPLPTLELAGDVEVGDEVCAVGNAFGLGVSATCGVVSATRKSGVGFNAVEDFVQTDAAVNPGASGGALVDADGRVVGILSAIFTKQADANIGVNFAVSAPLARRVFEDLRDDGRVAWPTPGIRLSPFPGPGGTGPAGAVVTAVQSDVTARSGLREGDILTHVDGRRVTSEAEFAGALARHRPPAEIDIKYRRDGEDRKGILVLAVPND